MARINLLPWRAERRKQRQSEFFAMLGGSAVAALLIGALGWLFFSGQIDGQIARNAYLTQEIAKTKEQNKEIDALEAKKANLLQRKQVIEELQGDRSQNVRLFDELVRTIPDGVKLGSIKQNGQVLTLNGSTQSNARVSSYMRNLESSGWITNPDLSVIEAKGDDRSLPYQFTLTVGLVKPDPNKPADGQTTPADPNAIAAPQPGVATPADAATVPATQPAPNGGAQ